MPGLNLTIPKPAHSDSVKRGNQGKLQAILLETLTDALDCSDAVLDKLAEKAQQTSDGFMPHLGRLYSALGPLPLGLCQLFLHEN